MKALLLASGLGTRLSPLTDHWPKCLMPIQGRPLLEYWLEALDKIDAVDHVLVNTHYKYEIVEKFLDRDFFRKWVDNVYEPELLGTAGTLQKNYAYFQHAPIMLIHADNWCLADLQEFVAFHSHSRPEHTSISMMTFETETPESCGIVELDSQGVVQNFYEKVDNPPGNLANAAVYILEPEVLEWLIAHPDITDFSTQVLPHFVGRIATWKNTAVHRDIGTPSELKKAQLDRHNFNDISVPDNWTAEFLNHPIHELLNAYDDPE